MSDLFSAAAEQHLRSQAPLAARLRPRTIDDVVGQDHLVGPGKALRRLVEQDRLTSAIFWGPPGTGKTTLALAVAGTTRRAFEQMSAVTAGVKDVREVIERARQRLGEHGRGTILFLDEIHRFSKSQQDALLPAVEDGTLTLIGATTENPFFEVNPPLRSRSTLFRLEPLDKAAIEVLVGRGLEAEGTTASAEAVAHLVDRAAGDGRQVLTALEVACALARPGPVELDHVESALGTSALRYGRDDHYDVVSAFIKSMRGSDPQAAVYYLARMLEAGEDARFIARRMVIFASEDVGMADPQALVVAVAAAHALEHVGLPEAQLNLSQAAIHLATAPKSNRAALAIWNARSDVQAGAVGEVPPHLRDAHYQGARSLGHGTDYEYPHDHPEGWVAQQYLPTDQAGKVYYDPTHHGAEAEVAERMERRRTMTAGELAVLLAAVLCCIGFAALIVVLMRVLDSLRTLRGEVESLRNETRPLILELRSSTVEARAAMEEARDDLDRFDRVLGSAEAISSAVAGGSRVARVALSAPVIKTAALATGTSRAVRRLRRKERRHSIKQRST